MPKKADMRQHFDATGDVWAPYTLPSWKQKASISSRLKDQGCAVMGEKEPYPQRLKTVLVVIINIITRDFKIINLLDVVSVKFTMEKFH